MKNVIKLSEAFSELIRMAILPEDLKKVNKLNEDLLRHQCATIEYCLSPLLMQDAFMECFGRHVSEEQHRQDDADSQLWAMAWMYSRINGFKSQRELCLITLN